jgi:hemolysin III
VTKLQHPEGKTIALDNGVYGLSRVLAPIEHALLTDFSFDASSMRQRVPVKQSLAVTSNARSFIHPDGCPVGLNWHYDRAEMLSDAIIHIVGLSLALIGAITLLVVSSRSTQGLEAASVGIYALGLVAMLGFSAAYNMWPVSPRKWWLRRFDHSAIFLFIAATYTPLIAQIDTGTTFVLLIVVWVVAAFGIGLKCLLPGRLDRLSIGLCLSLGASGIFVYESAIAILPSSTLWLIAAGGGLYSIGIIFHLWEGLRFHNAIWHSFVLVAASCHYAAIIASVA